MEKQTGLPKNRILPTAGGVVLRAQRATPSRESHPIAS
jgi:hypothetical protein